MPADAERIPRSLLRMASQSLDHVQSAPASPSADDPTTNPANNVDVGNDNGATHYSTI